jgi:trypsin
MDGKFCLQLHKDPVPAGTPVVISGFGSKRFRDSYPSVLLKYQEMAVEECPSEYIYNFEGFICLNSPRGTGACSGDSGGPAVFNGELVGVANFVYQSTCGTTKPDGFASVSYFYDWIHEHTLQI